MTDKPFVPERIYVPTKLNGALKGDKFFETPIDGVEYVREDVLKEEYAQKMLYVNRQSYDLGRKQAFIDARFNEFETKEINDMKVRETKVWKVNGKQMVVADTIEEAITVYKNKYEFPYNEVKSIEAVECTFSDNSAFIAMDNEDVFKHDTSK